MEKIPFKILLIFLSFRLILPATLLADQDQYSGPSRWVIDNVITGDVTPFAIGHRGYGENLGEIPGSPIENTKKAVRRAFREGIMIVEVDANLTADGVAVALHDDYFFNEPPLDFTCVNQLTLDELREAMPDVSTLRQILQTARRFSRMDGSDRPSGQVVVEIKTPSPICMPLDQEQAALDELVAAALGDIRSTRMQKQVTIESYSPEILARVAQQEVNIPRMLALEAAQLFPLEWIEENTEYDVRIIGKDTFGLTWGEVGIELSPELFLGFFRWPGYYTEETDGPLGNYMRLLGETGSSIASLDKNVLYLASFPEPPDIYTAAEIVEVLHFFRFRVLVYTVEFGDSTDPGYPDFSEWFFMSGANVDGMYVNDIPSGLDIEGN